VPRRLAASLYRRDTNLVKAVATKPKTADDSPATGVAAGAPTAPPATPEENVLHGSGSLEQIREILFGVEKSEYDRRFRLLESQVAEQGAALAGELREQLASLAAESHKALESLRAELSTERSERTDGARQLARDLKQAAAGIEKQLARLTADVERRTAALSARLTDESKSLSEQTAVGDLELARRHGELVQAHEELAGGHGDLVERHDALAVALANETGNLGDSKTDRRTLAALLREVADRLSDGSETPE